jgi:hypothetical protein
VDSEVNEGSAAVVVVTTRDRDEARNWFGFGAENAIVFVVFRFEPRPRARPRAVAVMAVGSPAAEAIALSHETLEDGAEPARCACDWTIRTAVARKARQLGTEKLRRSKKKI